MKSSQPTSGSSLLIGESAPMQRLRRRIAVAGATDPQITVHISGPSGSGKELVARELHCLNEKTRNGKFVAVDLSYVPRELAGSRLFGHEKGAFTDAHDRRLGAFEEGVGGTVFLDEVSSISLEFQGMFLRVLQEREFSPLGSLRVVRTNARIVAASNENLWRKVQRGLFRKDLFFRLQVLKIEVPGLAARKEDIPLLARHFIRKHAEKVGCRPDLEIEPSFLRALGERPWPGNVRQLENTMIQALAMAAGESALRAHHLIADDLNAEDMDAPIVEEIFDLPYPEAQKTALIKFKRTYWAQKLEQAQGNVSQAARLGGVLPASLHRMIKEIALRDDPDDSLQTSEAID